MADDKSPLDAIFRIVIQADIQRVWRELTKTDEAQGAVFNAWLHTNGLGFPVATCRCGPAPGSTPWWSVRCLNSIRHTASCTATASLSTTIQCVRWRTNSGPWPPAWR